jgi:hypothetical protein
VLGCIEHSPKVTCKASYMHSPLPLGSVTKIAQELAWNHYGYLGHLCFTNGDLVYATPAVPLSKSPPKDPQVDNVFPKDGPMYGQQTITVTGKRARGH